MHSRHNKEILTPLVHTRDYETNNTTRQQRRITLEATKITVEEKEGELSKCCSSNVY